MPCGSNVSEMVNAALAPTAGPAGDLHYIPYGALSRSMRDCSFDFSMLMMMCSRAHPALHPDRDM